MKYKWRGISEEVLNCEHCGRTNLKKTIALEDENGGINYFGSECTIKLLGWSQKQIKEEMKREENTKKKEREEIVTTARIRYKNHPNVIKVNSEITEANKNNVPPPERKEKGMFKRWIELENQAKQEIMSQLNIKEDIFF